MTGDHEDYTLIVLQAVKVRGESMAAAAKIGKAHGMLSIIGLEDGVLSDICAKVRLKLGSDVVCQTANFLFPTGRVVSGHKDALNEVQVSVQNCFKNLLHQLGGFSLT